MRIALDELEQVRIVAISAKDMLKGGLASVTAGNLVGMAATGGIVSTVTAASTGTVLSALSGAAATNATLAALGGGSLAAGGLGMAGGAAVMSGLAAAPVLMVGGIMLNGKAGKALENAKDVQHEANKAIEKMKEAESELKKVQNLSQKIQQELKKLNEIYVKLITCMEETVSKTTDYRKFSYEEKRTLEKTVLALKLLKDLSMQNILDPEKSGTVLDAEIDETLKKVSAVREEKLVA